MSSLVFYHTGRLQVSQNSTEWMSPTLSNVSISYSPEYITHKNIKSNEINILKGYSVSVSIEAYFLNSNTDTYLKLDEFIEILNSIKANNNGILGFQNNIYIRFLSETGYQMTMISLNKLSSDINVSDYISNNMNIGQKIEIKLSHSDLLSKIPIWVTLDSTYTNTVSSTAQAGKMIATNEDWI